MLAGNKRRLLLGGGHHHQIAHVRGAQVGAHGHVEGLVGGRHRAQGRQFAAPHAVALHHEQGTGGHEQHQDRPSHPPRPFNPDLQAAADGGDIVHP